MKFFKHFTDADEGTLNDLMNRLGVDAYGRYWLFTEFCIKGLEKPSDREFAETDMKFSFNERQLREKLRIKSTNLVKFLGTCSELNLFEVTRVEDKFNIYFPKILKFLDRDSKRARKKRNHVAPDARLDKEEDKDKEEDREKDEKASVCLSSGDEKSRTEIERIASGNLARALAHVPVETQEFWLSRWGGDAKKIAGILEICLMKRQSKNLPTKIKDLEFIMTQWLLNERPETFSTAQNSKEWQNPDQGPHPGGEDAMASLLARLNVKSLTEMIRPKESGHAV